MYSIFNSNVIQSCYNACTKYYLRMIIRPPPWTVWVDSIVSKVLSIINLIGRGNYTYHTINSYIIYEVWKKYDGQLIIPSNPKYGFHCQFFIYNLYNFMVKLKWGILILPRIRYTSKPFFRFFVSCHRKNEYVTKSAIFMKFLANQFVPYPHIFCT